MRFCEKSQLVADNPLLPVLAGWGYAEHVMKYQYAVVKFKDGMATLLCNGCGATLAEGIQHEDREHYCIMCMSGNCKAKFKDGN